MSGGQLSGSTHLFSHQKKNLKQAISVRLTGDVMTVKTGILLRKIKIPANIVPAPVQSETTKALN